MVDGVAKQGAPDKRVVRILKILSKRTSSGIEIRSGEVGMQLIVRGKNHSVSNRIFDDLVKKRYAFIDGNHLKISLEGMRVLRAATGMELVEQVPNRSLASHPGDAGMPPTLENLDESPLKKLVSLKTKNGTPYLSDHEFQAGERLRRDFEIAQLQPKISANYSATAGSSGKGGHFQVSEISDFALDARNRIDAAVSTLGPELSGVALDVCCFLKGLELVERERSWPPRSAKLMLKTCLSVLARHYGISGFENRNSGKISAWNREGYRPPIRP